MSSQASYSFQRSRSGAEVARERLLAPRAMHRRRDRRERRDRAVAVRVLEADRERAVAAHGMAEDALPLRVDREVLLDQLRQLARDVRVHPVVARPGLFRRVQVEAGGDAEVPGVAVARQRHAARARVRRDQREPELGGDALRARLDHEGLFGAGEPGEVPQHRHPPPLGLRRQVDGEPHRAGSLGGGVAVKAHRPAEGGVPRDQFGLFGQAFSTPLAFAVCVAMASIRAGLRQS